MIDHGADPGARPDIGVDHQPDLMVADPAVTDGDKYQVVLENARVRVLRYHDQPGARTHRHRHPAFVMVPLAPFRRRLTFADGTTRERAFKAGEVVWMPAQTHVGENIGDAPTDVVLIELKE
jgi:quercetin dioxygenase-like cupin family protein